MGNGLERIKCWKEKKIKSWKQIRVRSYCNSPRDGVAWTKAVPMEARRNGCIQNVFLDIVSTELNGLDIDCEGRMGWRMTLDMLSLKYLVSKRKQKQSDENFLLFSPNTAVYLLWYPYHLPSLHGVTLLLCKAPYLLLHTASCNSFIS